MGSQSTVSSRLLHLPARALGLPQYGLVVHKDPVPTGLLVHWSVEGVGDTALRKWTLR